MALFLRDNIYFKSLYLFFLALSSLVGQFIPVASVLSVNLHFMFFSHILNLLLILSVFSLIYYLASKKVGLKSKSYLYPLYFLVYQPLWLTIILAGFIRVYILKKKDVEDWVV